MFTKLIGHINSLLASSLTLKKKISFIDSNSDLNNISSCLAKEDIIGLDTEFDWRNTYFPKLSLLQISTKSDIFLIDCLNCSNFKKLKNVLEDRKVLKVFHSIRSDATVLSKCLNIFVNNTFDIQLAQKMLNRGEIENYGSIVFQHIKKILDKSQTNSNWLKRPLTDIQLKYASEDVNYLIEIYFKQKKILSESNYIKILKESTSEAYLGNEKLSTLRIKKNKKKLSRKGHEIFIWREEIAENQNLPPSFICKDKDINKLSKLEASYKNSRNKEIIKIFGDSYYVDEFIKKFL